MTSAGRFAVAILVVAIATVPALAGRRCPSTKQAKTRTRTVAWVTTTCRTDANGLVGQQQLHVQRGDGEPVVVSRIGIGPVPDPGGLCRLFGASRQGSISVAAGFFTGLAVSPDGGRVVFEVNDGFSILGHDQLTEDEKGFYLVRADGSDLVKLGPAARTPPFRQFADGAFDYGSERILFSPDGRRIVFSDLGPTSEGGTNAQLWTLRLGDREPTQLTRLARLFPDALDSLFVFDFIDNSTVGFYTLDYYPQGGPVARQAFYTVSIDGKNLRELAPIVGPNGQVLERFALAGGRPAAQGLFVDGTADNPMSGFVKPRELFVATRKNLLQLTNFNRVDVGNLTPAVSRNGERVFFSASADPFGCNPTHNCQLFSVSALGGHLRQLTRFDEGEESQDGCFFSPAPGCPVRMIAQDRVTGSLIYETSCDPLGTNPAGNQVFAMHPDGAGLRQITRARGVIVDTPEMVEVELPGPVAYQ